MNININIKINTKNSNFQNREGILKFKNNTLLIDFLDILENFSPKEIYNNVKEILDILKGLDSRGYLNTLNIRYYPLINKLIPLVVLEKRNKEGEKIKDKKGRTIRARGREENYINGIRSMVTYRWIYAILILNLYTLVEILRNRLEKEKDTDFYSDLTILSKNLYDSLEPSIRKFLSKRGMSITQNIQNAFDTEYKNEDMKTNGLLSIQMAVNVVSYLKIHKPVSYVVSNVNALTNKSYEVENNKNINFELIEKAINECGSVVRKIK